MVGHEISNDLNEILPDLKENSDEIPSNLICMENQNINDQVIEQPYCFCD